jgi:DNA-binding GntR family transcriptional regulator
MPTAPTTEQITDLVAKIEALSTTRAAFDSSRAAFDAADALLSTTRAALDRAVIGGITDTEALSELMQAFFDAAADRNAKNTANNTAQDAFNVANSAPVSFLDNLRDSL